MSRSRTIRGLVLAAVTACALSACSTHPGSAAVVGSDAISDGQLDDVATALCAAQSTAQTTAQQDLSSRAARQGALSVLVNASLSRQFGASRGLEADQGQVSAAVTANQSTIDSLPASERPVFKDTLTQYAEGQLMLIDLGTRELAKAGTANPTQQQALAAATKLRDSWAAKHAPVSLDPRYGTYTKGAFAATSGSLSAPVSANAVAGAKAAPAASWVTALPASQKCG